MTRTVLLSLVLAAGLPMGFAQAEESVPTQSNDRVIGPDMDVALDYTLTVEGVVVDSTAERGPLRYIHGQGQLFPALERQLEGLHVGAAKEVTLSPAEGYGEIDSSLIEEVAKADLPADTAPTVGMVLRGVNTDGQSFQARVVEIKPDTVMLNLNDPLAGKTLHFKITVMDIAPLPTQ